MVFNVKSLDPDMEEYVSKTANCSGCSNAIPEARLKAVPDTTLCVDCASLDGQGSKRRTDVENFGTRDDWQKDHDTYGSGPSAD